MKFDKLLKANSEIFKKAPILNVNEHIILTRIYDEILDAEAEFYLMNCNDDELKRFLPVAYVNTQDESVKKILDFIGKPLFKSGFLLCIRSVDNKYPVGYILLESPITNSGLDDWLISFWLKKTQRGVGIMSNSIVTVLDYLRTMSISKVQATVNTENLKSINTLERTGFSFVPGQHFGIKGSRIEKSYLYEIKL